MKYAIIAAGEGSRLAEEGIAAPKPLVMVGGESLIDRLLRIFRNQGARETYVICRPDSNPRSDGSLTVENHLRQLHEQGMPLHVLVKATPSSMHSLHELSMLMGDEEPFCLTTVDTIFREDEFTAYTAELHRLMENGEADGLMGVTEYIDDEKPLYVRCDADNNITAFLDSDDQPRYVSAGIYGLSPRAFATLRACIERGDSRMRNFQRALLTDGMRLKAWPLTKVLDIDHADDIRKAEDFLSGGATTTSAATKDKKQFA